MKNERVVSPECEVAHIANNRQLIGHLTVANKFIGLIYYAAIIKFSSHCLEIKSNHSLYMVLMYTLNTAAKRMEKLKCS